MRHAVDVDRSWIQKLRNNTAKVWCRLFDGFSCFMIYLMYNPFISRLTLIPSVGSQIPK
jgi:hypothetical protein